MDNRDMSREELEKALEKAKRDAQAMFGKLTPEERARVTAEANRRTEEDRAARQKLLDDARAILAGSEPKRRPKFCPNCGAPVSGGKFCTNCGSPLQA